MSVTLSVSQENHHVPQTADFKSVVRAMGLVFGDIGTSPIYTMTVVFLLLPGTSDNILGVVSLIIWTLIILVFGQYIFIAMRIDHFGEGGVFILRHIALKYIRKSKTITFFSILGYVGAALLLGDGVITPSISILSAVEGIRLVPIFSEASTGSIVTIAVFIALLLFFYQSYGSDRVALTFGPIMLIWFTALGLTGIFTIFKTPVILNALNPVYALKFCMSHGIATFLILAQVILCATGAEALYADIGHIGKKPIIRAWFFVFIALVLSYLGQGAFLLKAPGSILLLFGMVSHLNFWIYVSFLILSILATVIASQSLISGAFSLIYQAIMMHKLPQLRVSFTSPNIKSQIYLPFVNWSLMAAVIFMMLYFKKSENLAAAYGLAVTGTMTVTSILLATIFFRKRAWIYFALCFPLIFIDISFFISCLTKLPSGGYWSLIVASIPLMIIAVWTTGEDKLRRTKQMLPIDQFLVKYEEAYRTGPRIPGTAIFAIADYHSVPPYIVNSMFRHGTLYETQIFCSLYISDEPHGCRATLLSQLASNLFHFEIHVGYMDMGQNLYGYFTEICPDPRVFYYQADRIFTRKSLWTPYAIMKRLARTYVSYFNISMPVNKIHGVLYRSSFD